MGILTYKNESFYMDGKPYTVISGAIHYFRVPSEYWRDRLLKLKECGFNTLETYTCWNLHEPSEGCFDFSGNLDIAAYVELANELGLNVILRPGPYICAEWDLGGLPAWLLNRDNIPLRCYNGEFLEIVKRYYRELLSRVRPYLASKGGNIIMLQIENEYGSYGDDKEYLRAIADIYRENEMDCLYFTSDGPSYTMLNGGTLDEHLCVANFGSQTAKNIGFLRDFRKDQPAMCGEFWCGWFDHWHEGHHVRDAESVCADFEEFFKINASVSVYMFHGGTNFGFMNGANDYGVYEPTVTSYDYCAPLSEAGDRTPTYYRMRETVEKYFGPLPEMTARESEKRAYGRVDLIERAYLFENLEEISSPIKSAAPKFMEEIGQNHGYILYRSTLCGPWDDLPMFIDELHDRAWIFKNGKLIGIYDRNTEQTKENAVRIPLEKGERIVLDILVENMGRVNYGPKLRDRKGLRAVRFDNTNHFGWDIYPLPMKDLSPLCFRPIEEKHIEGPVFMRGHIDIEDTPCDTFVRLDGFTKGFVEVNGVNIGRYYNTAGPQKTLYIPAPFLKKGRNGITVFESEKTDSCTLALLDKPDLG